MIPTVPEQIRMTQEMNERIALESSLEVLRKDHQIRRLLKYARALKGYSDSQAECIESLSR